MTQNTTNKSNIEPIELIKTFDVNREELFRYLTEAEHLKTWYCPVNFTMVDFSNSLKIDGTWLCKMKGPNGKIFQVAGEYLTIDSPLKLEYTHYWIHDENTQTPKTKVTIDLEEIEANKTKMIFRHQGFAHQGARDGHEGGWIDTFKNLDNYLN